MADFPIWLKMLVYFIVGSTAVYAIVSIVRLALG